MPPQMLRAELKQLRMEFEKLQTAHDTLLSTGTERASALHAQTGESAAIREELARSHQLLQRTLVSLAQEKQQREEAERALKQQAELPNDQLLQLCRTQENKIGEILLEKSELAARLAEREAQPAVADNTGDHEQLEQEQIRTRALREKLKVNRYLPLQTPHKV